MLLQTNSDVNQGRPRKPWFKHRRSLYYALLMGLHRKRDGADIRDTHCRKSIFINISHGNRYVSMQLGLPHSVLGEICDLEEFEKIPLPKEDMEASNF